MSAGGSKIDNGEVARRAYEIWQSRGCPSGDGLDDWNAALAELLAAPPQEPAREAKCDAKTAPIRVAQGEAHEDERGIRVWFMRVKRKLIGRGK